MPKIRSGTKMRLLKPLTRENFMWSWCAPNTKKDLLSFNKSLMETGFYIVNRRGRPGKKYSYNLGYSGKIAFSKDEFPTTIDVVGIKVEPWNKRRR